MKTPKVISIKNVSKSFGKNLVLDNVSLEIKKGEIFGLIGLNGAGKSTLIKLILGLLKNKNGEISVFNKAVDSVEAKKTYLFLPEKFNPSGYLKGKEYLSLSVQYYGKKYNVAKAEEIVEKLKLKKDFLQHSIKKYSKGMGQKIGLASAFLAEVPLLILDEPMSGLDPLARVSLKEALQDYVKNGGSVFFSSHILSDIDEICDEIAILHNGHILYQGTPKGCKEKYEQKSLEKSFLKVIDN
ncbi:MAG: ABC transporter ATP-binding protein [Alphaproteobacteria bacterium]|jgi:ABC-2 type transport system ATP-binding protein